MIASKMIHATLALSFALAGCLGGGTDDANVEEMGIGSATAQGDAEPEVGTLFLTDSVVEEDAVFPECAHVDVFGMGPDSGSDARVAARSSDPISSCPTYFQCKATESFTLSGDLIVRFWFACELPKLESDVLHQSFQLLVYRNGAKVTATAESGASGGLLVCTTEATEVRIETALDRSLSFKPGDQLTIGIEQYYVNHPAVPGYLYYLVGPNHPSGMTAPGLPAQVEEPALTVYDMSGEAPAASVGVFGVGTLFGVGTVPSGEDDKATVLIDFDPELGPGALTASICISEGIGYLDDCDAYEYSGGAVVQLDATGLSGKTLFIETDYGAGAGTTYVLCASVFDFHEAADGYTAIYDGHCRDAPADGQASIPIVV